ncbi:hypothetical protein [Algoriphagus jejuensis]
MLTRKEHQECQMAFQNHRVKRLIKAKKPGEKAFTTSLTSECSTTLTSI